MNFELGTNAKINGFRPKMSDFAGLPNSMDVITYMVRGGLIF